MTQPNEMIIVELDNATGAQQLPVTEVQRIINQHLNAARHGLAAKISMQAAEQLPQDLWPNYLAAESLYRHQQIESAFHYINRALELDPRHIASFVIKSRLCLYEGDNAQAVRLIDEAIGLAPQDSLLQSLKAELLVDAGDIDGAGDSFRKSIELDTRNSNGLLGLAQLPGDHFPDELIKKVEFIVQSRQLPGDEQIKAHFALAHAYDKKGNIARHFIHLHAGNALKNNSLQFDAAKSAQEAKDIIEIFSTEFFRRIGAEEGNPARVIFIVGFPRCGSTLVEQILASHPSVSGAGEVFALRHAIQTYQQSRKLSTSYPHWIDQQPAGALTTIADGYMQRVKRFNQSNFLTDKLLDNYLFIGVIHLIFPNAKIINVQRNPIDVCYSCYKRVFNLSSLPYAYDLENLAGRYRDYRKIMTHWNSVLPGKIHTLDYEELVHRQDEVTRDLLEYCGLPWDDACLNFQENERTVLTQSNAQVRQALHADSIDRWKIYKEYLGPLMDLTGQ